MLCLLLTTSVHGELRCALYRHEVRRQAAETLGSNYPFWYNLGQLQQESRCRPDITAFDGGQGLAQFMPATAAAISRREGVPLDPYKPLDAIRLQAVFLRDLRRSCPAPRLWATYQAYNGGCKLLVREAGRAGAWEHDAMLAMCARNKIKLKSGRVLDLCAVNYDYSRLISKYAEPHRAGPDEIPFW